MPLRIIVSLLYLTLAAPAVATTIECIYTTHCTKKTGCYAIEGGGFALGFNENSVKWGGVCLNKKFWREKQHVVNDIRILLICENLESPRNFHSTKINRNTGEFEQMSTYSNGSYDLFSGYCIAAEKKF